MKKDKISELSKYVNKSEEAFKDIEREDGVLDATEIFAAKKKDDEWWKKAIERMNKLLKGEL